MSRWHVKQIQAEADKTLQKLGDGGFSTEEKARELVQYRKGLLKAIEILTQKPNSTNDDLEDD